MDHYDKFLPQGVPAWQRPFWDSLREHAIKVQKCDGCGAFRYVPKEICNRCLDDKATWTPLAGHGRIYTYTVVRRAPTKAYQETAPYALVHVTMAEGFRMIGSLRIEDPESITIGQMVRVGYDDVTPDWTLLQFEPV
ncbi:OB-fold domain-containing protein [Nocardioides sp. WS12]|uniref:Zn-ribbon domain-containing OB-fold protein n=1 Tax=Nocardioides sp. WS12 TaxID=2486272 RepID=UPI0015F91DB1|nr:OB-fold domain-containing protein [Nocardioides sp. WS12]